MIHEELKTAESSIDYIKESEDDEKNRIMNMVFGQLVTACYNMIGFRLDKKVILDIINSFAIQNQLNHDLIKSLESIVVSENS